MSEGSVKKAGIGSTFDQFLKDEGIYEATEAVAIERVLAWKIKKAANEPAPHQVGEDLVDGQ